MQEANFQGIFDSLSKRLKDKRYHNKYNLGQFISDLSKYPEDAEVIIYPFYLYPIDFDSYRGYYEDLALSYSTNPEHKLTAGELLQKAKECINKNFSGYKGGSFQMDKNSIIWLANYGETTDILLSGIRDRYNDGSTLELLYTKGE